MTTGSRARFAADGCRHFARPGLSAGYCAGRDDLPLAYGTHHPLRKLPTDCGRDCASYDESPASVPGVDGRAKR